MLKLRMGLTNHPHMAKIRCSHIPAWYAKEMLSKEVEPEELVRWCEYYNGKAWAKIGCDEIVDEVFDDWMHMIEWAEEMSKFNFSFVGDIKLNRGAPSGNPLPPAMVDPMFHAIMANGYATMNELKTVYSLQEAFMMLDSITTTKINEYIAYKEAQRGK